ncbi:MAG: uncharacterized protein H6Q67_761 [Firmicutes bacterium]|nr:uncharacterized protein [Bacillota bacterium]
MANINPDDFVVLYPGVYTKQEKALVEKYLADNKAIEERGEIDVQALIKGTLPKDTPGLGPVLKVTEAMVRYNNEKYDPENPVLNDAAYAKKLGYKDILALPCFGAHDDSFMVPYPPDARDTLLVSQLNHSVNIYKPVYPGDTLYMVFNSRHLTDLTPTEGSIYRHVIIKSTGSVYNQRGEKVNDVVFRVMESLKLYKEGKRPAVMGFAEFWESAEWASRPAHYYTDEDWKYIKDLWSKEKRQGAQPLYWEDVQIGDKPTWTVDGPVISPLIPTAPYGLATGGSRTLKREILDPAIFKNMIRGEHDGIYRLQNEADYVPAVPDGAAGFLDNAISGDSNEIDTADIHKTDSSADINTADIHKKTENRGPLLNFLGREFAERHIFNWMGDHGWLANIRWGIMPVESMYAYGKKMPLNKDCEYFLKNVPEMKGKTITAHGMTEDLAIVKSYVYDKYNRDGEYFVDLTWWIETIEGDIWLAGGATVKLPSSKMK